MSVSVRAWVAIRNERRVAVCREHTFGSHVFCALHFVHGLEGLCLFPGKGLFIVVFAGAADAIEEDAAA